MTGAEETTVNMSKAFRMKAELKDKNIPLHVATPTKKKKKSNPEHDSN